MERAAVRDAVRAALAPAVTGTVSHWTPVLDPEAFVREVARQRVAGLVLSVAAGEPPEVTGALRSQLHADVVGAMTVVQLTRRVLDLLEGIDLLVLKGPALAVQTTGDFTSRGGGDVDLLARPGDVAQACERLTRAGWRIRAGLYPGDPGAWAWDYMLRTTYEITLDGPHGTVDLHWRLDPTRDGLPAFAALRERRAVVDMGGLAVPTLAVPDAFRHALRHAAKDRWASLRSLVDIHRLAGNPDAWPGAPLRRIDTTTLRVVQDCIGLPDSLPLAVRSLIPEGRQAATTRALQAQALPLDHEPLGSTAWRTATYRLRSSRTPRDLATTLTATVLPCHAFPDLADTSGLTAAPRAAGRRARGVARRLRELRP